MAEEAQELTVTNTGQPVTFDLAAAVTPVEVAQELQSRVAAAAEVNIEAAAD